MIVMAEFKREDVVTVLREKSGYYKKDLRKVLDALEETLIAIMATAQIDDPVEIRLFDGFYVQAKREPERPATDPRTGENIIAREKIKPNVNIRRSFKWRIEREAGILPNKDNEEGENENE